MQQHRPGQVGASRMQIGGTWPDPVLCSEVRDNEPYLSVIGDDRPKKFSWKPNGDGIYTPIGA